MTDGSMCPWCREQTEDTTLHGIACLQRERDSLLEHVATLTAKLDEARDNALMWRQLYDEAKATEAHIFALPRPTSAGVSAIGIVDWLRGRAERAEQTVAAVMKAVGGS